MLRDFPPLVFSMHHVPCSSFRSTPSSRFFGSCRSLSTLHLLRKYQSTMRANLRSLTLLASLLSAALPSLAKFQPREILGRDGMPLQKRQAQYACEAPTPNVSEEYVSLHNPFYLCFLVTLTNLSGKIGFPLIFLPLFKDYRRRLPSKPPK